MKTQTQPPTAGSHQTLPPGMELALAASFGSVDLWRLAFVSALRTHGAASSDAGNGWLLLLLQASDATLAIQWVSDLARAPAESTILLSVKLAISGDDDWDAFPESIAWVDVAARYQAGIYQHGDAYAATHAEASQAMLIDVRREGVFKAATTRIVGAHWHNPATVAQWVADLPTDREIVVYCVYGHEVSRAIAIRLRATGINARYMQGGIDGWQAAGLATESITAPQTRAASPSAS